MKRLIILILLLAGCTSGSATSPSSSGSSESPSAPISASPPVTVSPPASLLPVAAIKLVHDPKTVTGQLSGPCHTRDNGRLPDPNCTPGAIDPSITKAKLCAPDFTTKDYRPSAAQTDKAKWDVVVPAYGLTSSFKGELDHLIPLELGGANDLSNLWPEAGKIPNPKDPIENALHDDVCSGKISLIVAQAEIAQNWENVHA